MKFRIEPQQVEYKKIIIENDTETDCLCRVDINHRLFKIIYLEPRTDQELLYDTDEEIYEIKISKLK